MAETPSVLDEAKRLIENRLKEIEDERKRLGGALDRLAGRTQRQSPVRRARRKPGRPPKAVR